MSIDVFPFQLKWISFELKTPPEGIKILVSTKEYELDEGVTMVTVTREGNRYYNAQGCSCCGGFKFLTQDQLTRYMYMPWSAPDYKIEDGE